jgi:hypothetical protein
MSDENSNERDHVVKATDEPEVEGHAVIKQSDEVDDDPEVEGHAHVKAHIKNVES